MESKGKQVVDDYILKAPVGMPRGTSLCIADGRGILVNVSHGEVWLTQDGSNKDHLLRSGESFRLDRDGAAILHSFRRSAVTLASPDPEYFARRITLTRAGSVIPEVLYQRSSSFPLGKLVRGLRARWHALRTGPIANLG